MKFIKAKLISVNDFISANWKLFLFLILAVQCGMLITVFIFSDPYGEPDTMSYVTPALNFLETGIMLDGAGVPIWFRTPGYPFFLAVIYKLTNYNNTCVLILQMLMCLLNTVMIFYTVNTLTSKKTPAVLAALFYIIDIGVCRLANVLMTDVPFSFLITLTVFLLAKYKLSNKKIYAVLSILAINYALLVRPAVMYLCIITAFIMLIILFRRKTDWKLPALYIAVFIAVFGGWTARNYYYHGEAVYSPILGESYYRWFAPQTFKIENNIIKNNNADEIAKAYFQKLMDDKYPDFENMSRLDKINAEKDIGSSYIKEHIFSFIKLNILGLLTELFGPNWSFIASFNISNNLKYLTAMIIMGAFAVLYLIYAAGFLSKIKRLNWLDWVIFLSACYLMASTAVLGYSRYRLAFYTLCIIGAFTCWKNFYENKNSENKI